MSEEQQQDEVRTPPFEAFAEIKDATGKVLFSSRATVPSAREACEKLSELFRRLTTDGFDD